MLDDMVEGAFSGIARATLFLARLLVQRVLVTTGELVLWLVTAGRRRPPWESDRSERPAISVLFFEVSTWVGLATWLTIVVWFQRLRS